MNKHVGILVKMWEEEGALEQEGFDWSSSLSNWVKSFPSDSDFIFDLPQEINREHVRDICSKDSYGIREKFLAIMIWGYGDRGYGPYRVTQMLKQSHSESVLTKVFELSHAGKPLDAYDFLMNNRVRILGPSYGSKFLTFCTPREVGAPIYDSLISLWVDRFARNEFEGVSISAENWNLKTYSSYWNWIKEHSKQLNCFPDQVELAIFRDAEKRFSKKSKWITK